LDDAALNGNPRAAESLRRTLITAGALAHRDEHLARVELYLRRTIRDHPQFAGVLQPYVRWSVLPRLRRRAHRRPTTTFIAQWATARIRSAVQLLDWAEKRGSSLEELAQEDVDEWLTSGKSTRYNIRDFLAWTHRRGYTRDLLVPHRGKPDPVGIDEDCHWDVLQQCLNDDGLPLEVRVAGALLHTYAIPLTRIVRLTSNDIQDHPSGSQIVLAQHAVPLLPPLAALIAQLAAQPERRRTAPNDGPTWLFRSRFPGCPVSGATLRHPDRPMPVETLRPLLNRHGIRAKAARVTACLNLAQDLPPAVLASITGMHVTTAEQWRRRAAPDWSAYIEARRSAPRRTC
jgi:hypothetical protein